MFKLRAFDVKFIFPFFLALLAPMEAHAFARRAPTHSCAVNLEKVESTVFKKSSVAKANPEKSILLHDIPVKNQMSYGCCWISAPLARWERMAGKKFGKHVDLSDDFLIYASLMYKIEESLYAGLAVTPGGWADVADWMAQNIGVIPESAWKPKIDLRAPGVGSDLIVWLNEEVARVRARLPLMIEYGIPADQVWNVFEESKLRIMADFQAKVGAPPTRFTFDGKKYTPHEFAHAIAPREDRWTFIEMEPTEPRYRAPFVRPKSITNIPSNISFFDAFPSLRDRIPKSAHPFDLGTKTGTVKFHELYSRVRSELVENRKKSLSEIHVSIIESLKAGREVYVALPMVDGFYNDRLGVLSVAAFGKTIEDVKRTSISGGHGMLITGAYRDIDGTLIGYRIQNSWGDHNGELGYYTMDIDYFDAFLDGVIVPKKIGK